jgi:Ca2+-binding EF-hand superfamily protein
MADRRERYLWDLFQRVDTDHSGSISVHELQTALVNGDWSPFNIETVRMMVGIFDTGTEKTSINPVICLWYTYSIDNNSRQQRNY